MQVDFQPLGQSLRTVVEAGVILAGVAGYYYFGSASPIPKCAPTQKDAQNDSAQALERLSIADLPSKVVHLAQDASVTNLRDLLFRTVPAEQLEGHYIHSLNIAGKFQGFEVYGHPNKSGTTSVIHFGDKLCGHPGIVHGGCISTVFDELFGWTMMWTSGKLGFTANLSVNFRKPLPAEIFGIVFTDFDKLEGRKLFMKARLEDNEGTLYADATALFILPKEQT
ncbi:hypothetical protein H257_01150 [Aphanomyces astaci]|uniref:Thioesterase domain-containing protein n=1 Tax=Aphanomyces astaci TaxID=112090 RepID=W4H6L2_APHAT|nr:hypothetical protein H257_01150 [Aphanomyces astaci]ETV87650.1 hypothetical protein H257_01150 [Aphanomyces astaci]|eukprot:XP_009822513.1 hypothetical protein H257_01150 [Aphanomyces astaci]